MFGLKKFKCVVAALLTLALIGCGSKGSQKSASAPTPATNQQVFQVKGVVQELKPDGKTAVIKHEEIPGYMPAMVMPFEVKDSKELTGLKPGDVVAFRMIGTETDGWIDQVKKLSSTPPTELPTRSSAVRIVSDVERLNVGDPLPEYHFTNELGSAVSTSQFKGQALAFTFLFTRCPFPTMCPLMSNNFSETQKKLLALPNGPTNWHLLTISFDPEFDTPTVLKSYAERYKYDPQHWNFVTGGLLEITAIAEQVGLTFWRLSPNEPISHNLRTVVVDAQGRVQKIMPENKWTSDELVAEIVKAAKKE